MTTMMSIIVTVMTMSIMIHDEDDDDEDDDEDDDDCEMMHERLILYLLHTSLATNTKNQPSQAPKTGEHQRIDC